MIYDLVVGMFKLKNLTVFFSDSLERFKRDLPVVR